MDGLCINEDDKRGFVESLYLGYENPGSAEDVVLPGETGVLLGWFERS